jgi:hypothetical protein
MTEQEVKKHIALLKERARAAEYPIDDRIKLSEWRTNHDNLRQDVERLEFLLKGFPNRVTVSEFPG